MSLIDWIRKRLHEQYETHDGRAVLFECTECGYRTQSLGGLHAHVERHWHPLKMMTWFYTHLFEDDPAKKWMDYTRVIAVDGCSEVELDDVEMN